MTEHMKQFFAAREYAVIGVSRSRHKFGNTILREMRKKGLTVHAVHRELRAIDGVTCFPTIAALPPATGSVVICVKPTNAEAAVIDCCTRGITNIWLQQGAESAEAISYARAHGLNLIHGHCVLMFVQPVTSIHAVHRWFSKLTGSYSS